MFGLFKTQKTKANVDFSAIAVDFHSHLIPRVDDGVQSIQESRDIIEYMKNLGYQKLITTPHIMDTHFTNSMDNLTLEFNELKPHIQDLEPAIRVDLSAEYLLDEGFEELIKKKEFITFGKNNILIELSMMNEFPFVGDYIFELNKLGYKPILAHPERYKHIYESPNFIDKYEELKLKGVRLQLNMFALIGLYGAKVQKVAESLIDNGLYDYVCSDIHHANQLNLFEEVKKSLFLEKLTQSNKLKNKELL